MRIDEAVRTAGIGGLIRRGGTWQEDVGSILAVTNAWLLFSNGRSYAITFDDAIATDWEVVTPRTESEYCWTHRRCHDQEPGCDVSAVSEVIAGVRR